MDPARLRNAWAWWSGRSSKPVCGLAQGRGGSIPPHSAGEGRETADLSGGFLPRPRGEVVIIVGDRAVRWRGEVVERLIRSQTLRLAGLREVAWQMAETSGYYQLVFKARRG